MLKAGLMNIRPQTKAKITSATPALSVALPNGGISKISKRGRPAMSVSRSKPQDQAVLSLNRGLPFHIEAEQCVLGALLIDAFTATPHTVQYLELDDFHHKGHRVIFEACLNLHRNGGVIEDRKSTRLNSSHHSISY